MPKRDFARKHDTLLRYSPSVPTFNVDAVRIPYSGESQARLKYTARAFRSSGVYEDYRPNAKGKHPEDWWEMQPIMPSSKERTGYPTQKPLKLLDRIIRASSNKGDMVLDPFCGCATTCVSAEKEGRQWTGIDVSPKAGYLVVDRIKETQGGLWREIVHRTDVPQRTDLGPLPHPRTHKRRLYGHQEGNCEGCREHFESRHLEVDHIIARRKGGTDHIDNLQLLCGSCNRIKGDRGMEYLRMRLKL